MAEGTVFLGAGPEAQETGRQNGLIPEGQA